MATAMTELFVLSVVTKVLALLLFTFAFVCVNEASFASFSSPLSSGDGERTQR